MRAIAGTYAIVNIDDLDITDFNQVIETSISTVRKSIDESQFLLKWNTEPLFIIDSEEYALVTGSDFENIQNNTNTVLTQNISGYNSDRYAVEHIVQIDTGSGVETGYSFFPVPTFNSYPYITSLIKFNLTAEQISTMRPIVSGSTSDAKWLPVDGTSSYVGTLSLPEQILTYNETLTLMRTTEWQRSGSLPDFS